MSRWLTQLFGPYRPYPVDDLIEELAPGHKDRMMRLNQRWEEEDKQGHEKEAHDLKKARLEQELKNAEWILEYEKKLNDLRKKTATQREQTASTGGDIKRLKQLDAYLENLGRNLSLD